MLVRWPTGRRIAFSTVFCLAVALTLAAWMQGLSQEGWLRALEVAGIVVPCGCVIALVIGLVVSKLADYQDPADEAEFERLVVPPGELAPANLPPPPHEHA